MAVEIIPAVIPYAPADVAKLRDDLGGTASLIQIDVGDGIMTERKTLQAHDFSPKDFLGISFEVHLMVSSPHREVDRWLDLGAKRVIVHAESKPKAMLLQHIEERGAIPIIALQAQTSLRIIEPYLHLVRSVLFLSIDPPGRQGMPFLESVTDKISAFHQRYQTYGIEVDGGMNPQTAKLVVRAGATAIIVGSWLYAENGNPRRRYAELAQVLAVI